MPRFPRSSVKQQDERRRELCCNRRVEADRSSRSSLRNAQHNFRDNRLGGHSAGSRRRLAAVGTAKRAPGDRRRALRIRLGVDRLIGNSRVDAPNWNASPGGHLIRRRLPLELGGAAPALTPQAPQVGAVSRAVTKIVGPVPRRSAPDPQHGAERRLCPPTAAYRACGVPRDARRDGAALSIGLGPRF